MDRNARLLGDATKASRIIEIGPSHAPIAAKAAGWTSTVVDHASQEDLRAKYAGFGVDLAAIEVVDFVWRGGRLDAAVSPPHHGSFDRLIASHVIEHIPDFVTFFESAQILLADHGALALAVPDKRFCFDALKPITTTGDILAAYAPDGAGRHSRRTLFNQVAYSVGMDGASAWGQHAVSRATFMNPLSDAIATWRGASEAPDSPYIDAHAWQFTPSAFQLALLELAEAGLVDWHVTDCTPAIGSEFIVTLHRGKPTWPSPAERDAHRLSLLLAMLVEQREQIDFAALGELIRIPQQAADPAVARALAALREELATQAAQLAALGEILALPTDEPARLGTLADITARLDAQQRALATMTAGNGTQASIMGFLGLHSERFEIQGRQLANLDAQLAGPLPQALAALTARLDAQDARLAEIGRVTATIGRILGPFQRLSARLRGRRAGA